MPYGIHTDDILQLFVNILYINCYRPLAYRLCLEYINYIIDNNMLGHSPNHIITLS